MNSNELAFKALEISMCIYICTSHIFMYKYMLFLQITERTKYAMARYQIRPDS